MAKPKEQGLVQDPPIYTIDSFCEAHHIARSYFYKLREKGIAPESFKLGRRTYIRGESAAKWRHRMEVGSLEA